MAKKLRHLRSGLLAVSFGALTLSLSAAAQNYPGQPYPAPNYPPYPSQPYPAQRYPAQNYPAQPAQAQTAPNQPVAASPVCVRLESQLAVLNSGSANSALTDQIKQEEDAIARQQADLDRTQAQARKVGCAGQGFFSLFSGFSPQCGPLNSQIDRMRDNLDHMMSDLEQLKSGNNDQQGQRTALIGQLAQNNCGSQYTQAARASGPQGFFEALLGGGSILSPGGNGAPAGTYQTVCVRTCDGYYFPISYSTVPGRFPSDTQACQRLCPAADVALYTYHNPGEEIDQAVSTDGAAYTALPNAFRYRKEVVPGCSCRKAGETWAQTLQNADDTSTLESGDIVVTDKNEKTLTRVPQNAAGKPAGTANAPGGNAAPAQPAANSTDKVIVDSQNRKVRVVGPPFLAPQ